MSDGDLGSGVAKIVDEAEHVAKLASWHAAGTDERRNVSDEVHDALLEAGFARHFVPPDFGGAGGGFEELAQALICIGTGCASSAWSGLILASSGRIAAFLPSRGQEDIWSSGPDVAIATALAPAGDARPGDGGWVLSGKWGFVSCANVADWAFLCSMGQVRGDRKPSPRFFAVPRRDFTVLDTWFTVGMRGTGSNTILLEDAFVPNWRTFPQEDLMDGNARSVGAGYGVPLLGVMPALFAAPPLGAAFGALDAWVGLIGEKAGGADRIPQDESTHLVLSQVSGKLETAQLLLSEAARAADAEEDMPQARVLRNARNAAVSADLTLGAMDALFRTAGTAAQQESSPIQRAWRDIHAATQHNVLRHRWTSRQFAELVWGGLRSGE